MHIVSVATLVGFFGDALTQLLINFGMGGPTGWGLKPYFKQHGTTESLFVAAGMLAIFFTIYVSSGLPMKIQYLAIYGVLVDLIFREANVFPSLKGYYDHFNHIWSGFWGALFMMLPLLAMKVANKNLKIT